MPLVEFIVEPYLSGVRVDSFLARHLRNYTSWRLHRMVVAGNVSINDIPATHDQRVARGQCVRIHVVEPPDKLLAPEKIPLKIVYEDPWLVVVDKPVGLVAHPVGDFQEGTLCNALQWHFDQQTTARGLLRPGIVHRLDRMTSGLIVVAKEHGAHRLLSSDFENGLLQKSYMALVEGDPQFESLCIDRPIGQYPGANSVLMSASPDAIHPRSAITDVVVRERFGNHALVECQLHTGRNHQIRVHLSHIGHPVLGDEYYGAGGAIRKSPRFDGEEPTEHRHALHAAFLCFRHPILQATIEFRSEPPADFWSLSEQQPSSLEYRL